MNPYGTNEHNYLGPAKRTKTPATASAPASDGARDGSRSKSSSVQPQKTPEQKNRTLRQSATSVSTEVCTNAPLAPPPIARVTIVQEKLKDMAALANPTDPLLSPFSVRLPTVRAAPH